MAKKTEIGDLYETKQLHLSSRFTSAVDYARMLHIERRKGTDIPYMAHLRSESTRLNSSHRR